MSTRSMMAGLLVGAALVGGCGDGNEPGGGLDEQEQAALTAALGQAGMLGLETSMAFGALVGQASDIGTMGDYSALATQALITLNFEDQASETYVISGIFGWADLNAGNNTVGKAIALQVFQDIGTFPTSIDEGVLGDIFGRYFDGATNSQYLATTGEFTMNASGFGGFDDCPNLPPDNQFFDIVTCRFAFGTMEGEFNFESNRITGSGAETFSQPVTPFELPALRLELEINASALELTNRAGWSAR